MSRIIIEAEQPELLAGLLRGAIAHQIYLIEAGLRKTEQRLTDFEQRYNMETATFYQHYTQGTLGDQLDYMEWAGEYETLQRLHEQDKGGNLVFRYDMAPHHPEISTFPHHKHIGPEPGTVVASLTPMLAEVLHEIETVSAESLLT